MRSGIVINEAELKPYGEFARIEVCGSTPLDCDNANSLLKQCCGLWDRHSCRSFSADFRLLTDWKVGPTWFFNRLLTSRESRGPPEIGRPRNWLVERLGLRRKPMR